jgi:phenylalanyl-tRNA synthetase beta chain
MARDYFGTASVVWWEINFAKLVKQAAWKRTFSAFPKYPSVVRDVAVIVDSTCAWEDLYREVKGTSGLIEQVELFDIFQSEQQLGVGKKSLAFSIMFRSPEKTLVSDDIEVVMQKILKNLKAKFKAEQR